ncbi:MAG: ShlB/FhaC/HecB family hemolysin secretion/activation protein [Pseudomonadota bacterium]
MTSFVRSVGLVSSPNALRGRSGAACRLWPTILLLAALIIPTIASAQVAVPGGAAPGRERQQFQVPEAPRAVPGGPRVSLPSTTAPAEAKTTKLVIRKIRVVGSTVYTQEQLAPLYEEVIGKRVTLQTVYDLAQKITAKYGADGYVLSRAIVPEQELDPKGASITIEVVEGYVDKVVWPEKLSRYRDFFTDYAARITADRPVNIKTLERYLLLANDLPGLKFTTKLEASKKNKGASTLIVEVTEKPVEVNARIDNRGTKSRGPLQFIVSPTINNVFGKHEALTISYAGTSPLSELQFVAPSWRQVLTSEGLTFFANGSYAWGYPGVPINDLFKFRTYSNYAEGGLSYPIVRAREKNLTVSGLAFASESYSYLGVSPNQVDRLRGLRAKLDGDMADSSGGINQFNITLSKGFTGLGSTQNLPNPNISFDGGPSNPFGRVDFGKAEGFYSRTQPLFDRFSAQIAAYGQYAFTPLMVPEQCGFGGRQFGRAFDPSDLLGDHCWMASAELRYDLPGTVTPFPNVQVYGFTDRGTRYIIAGSTSDVGTSQSAASAGGGVRLGWQNYLNVDLSAAKAIEGPRNATRFFFIATARY